MNSCSGCQDTKKLLKQFQPPTLYYLFLITGAELERTEQEVENLRKEVDKLKHCGETNECNCMWGSMMRRWSFVQLDKILFQTAQCIK